MEKIYLLYSCNEWKEQDSMRLVGATTDRDTLLNIVSREIRNGEMDYDGKTRGCGYDFFRADMEAGVVQFSKLDFGLIKETDNIQFSEKILEAYVNQKLRDGIFDEYTANIIMRNRGGVIDESKSLSINTACVNFLQKQDICVGYSGYGVYMLPLSLEEALKQFDSGKPVYIVYHDNTESLVDERSEIESGLFFYASEIEKPHNQKREEFIRQLESLGYQYEEVKGINHGCVSRDGQEVVLVTVDNELLYKSEHQKEAFKILALKSTVNEYMNAYREAVFSEKESNQGYYTLMEWAAAILCAKKLPNDSMQFVVWNKDRDGGYSNGYYTDNFEDAKDRFAERAGFVNKELQFTETEMKIIRSGLVQAMELWPDMTFEQEQAIKSVVSKIDWVIEPQLIEEAEVLDGIGEDDCELEM